MYKRQVLRILPLGGLGEIGKNMTAIEYGDDILIVDEFTGRLMVGRRWSEGLHQAVEAKEGVTIQHLSLIHI